MPLRNKRVLLVEDEPILLLQLRDSLDELGLVIVAAEPKIPSALNAARVEQIDLALLDINVDGQSVRPVAEALAGRLVPFAFVTGYNDHPLAREFGDRPCLHKPYSFEQLIGTLSGMLQEPASSPGHSSSL